MIPQISLLHHMARSGGSVITRCLAAASGAALLSEIHPLLGHWHDPREQIAASLAVNWPGAPLDRLRHPATAHRHMVDDVVAIAETCRRTGRPLLVRDWNHVDFVPNFMVVCPSYRSTLAEVLAPRLDLRRAASVRHPLDQWLSTIAMAKAERTDLDAFLKGCRRFAELAVAIGFVRYEDLAADPASGTATLCRMLSLPFDPGFLGRLSDVTTVTRDPSGIRGGEQVRSLERRPHPPELLQRLRGNADYQATVALLGYRP